MLRGANIEMNILSDFFTYFLSFQSYVMLPIIVFILAMIFRIQFVVAIKSSLQLGIAFIGIFMTFDFFVSFVNPAMKALIENSGLNMPVLDTGWPPLAAIAWNYDWAPILLLIFMAINTILLVMRLTSTINIDIWNYWHVIFLAALIHFTTGEVWMAIVFASISFVLVLKLAEWSAPLTNKLSGMKGICIPHLSGIIHFPIAVSLNWLLDKIPFLRKSKSDPETMKKKLGLLGEPMILGLIMGIILGIFAEYDIKGILNIAFQFAAVIFILPMMGGVLGSALVPISEGMKTFIESRFKKSSDTFIGLDVAILFGIPSVLVVAILLMPVSILLAIVLPGINFIPIGDLTNLLVPVGIISVATRGNMIKSFIIGIPVVVMNLYYASMFAPVVTEMATATNYTIKGYDGVFTSFLDAGNPYRSWLTNLLQGDTTSIALLPVVVALIIFTWRMSKKTRA
jgi:galactitol PTS system EIIC component